MENAQLPLRIRSVFILFGLVVAVRAHSQTTFYRVYPELNERVGPLSYPIIDDSGNVYFDSRSAELGTADYYLTKLSNEGEVRADVAFAYDVISTMPMGDKIVMIGHVFNGSDSVAPIKINHFDSHLNPVYEETIYDSSVSLIYSGNSGVFNEYSNVVELAIQWLDSSLYQAAFLCLDSNGHFDSLKIWEFPLYTISYGFAPLGDGYLMWAEYGDSIENYKTQVVHLNENLQTQEQLDISFLNYNVDSTFDNINQRIMEYATLLPFDQDRYILWGNARNFYIPGIPFDYRDADVIVGLGSLESDSLLKYKVRSTVFENAYAGTSLACRYDQSRFVAAETRGSSFNFYLEENFDSYVMVSMYDYDLNLKWERPYFVGDGKFQRAGAIGVKSDGGLVIIGHEYDPLLQNSFMYVLQTDSVGEVLGAPSIYVPDQQLSLFPMPAVGVVHIKSDMEVNEVRIFDLQGQELCSTSGQHLTTFSVSEIPAGSYIAVLSGKDFQTCRKIVVEAH